MMINFLKNETELIEEDLDDYLKRMAQLLKREEIRQKE